MSYQELSAAGENRFDHLTDAENKTVDEAWEVIKREQAESMGAKALLLTIEDHEEAVPLKPRTRRMFTGPHGDNDSAYDEDWNTRPAPIGDPAFEESKEAFRQFAQDAHAATAASNAEIQHLTPVEAAARMRLAEERRQNV